MLGISEVPKIFDFLELFKEMGKERAPLLAPLVMERAHYVRAFD